MAHDVSTMEADWQLTPAELAAWRLACGEGAAACADAGAAVPPMAAALASMPHVVRPLLRQLAVPMGFAEGGAMLHGDEAWTWAHPLAVATPYRVRGALVSHAKSRQGLALRLQVTLRTQAGAQVACCRSAYFFAYAGASTLAALDPTERDAMVLPEHQTHLTVDDCQPERYAAASGDDNPVHLSDAVAQAAGLRCRPLHGLCTLSFAARSVAAHPRAAGARLASLRGRFRRPVYPGDVLTCASAWVAAPGEGGTLRFVVTNAAGQTVVGRGAATLAPGT